MTTTTLSSRKRKSRMTTFPASSASATTTRKPEACSGSDRTAIPEKAGVRGLDLAGSPV
jgi:hypothetical protein